MTKIIPPWILIIDAADRLEITATNWRAWADLVQADGVIIWNRNGDARIIPNVVLKNAMWAYSDYNQMVAAGRLHEIPEGARFVHWAQTVLAHDRLESGDESDKADDSGNPPR